MSLTKFKRGGKWTIRGTIKVGGKSKSVYTATGVAEEEAAEILRVETERSIIYELLHGAEHVATFNNAAESYLEGDTKNRFVSKVCDAFGDRKLKSIGQSDLDRAARKAYPGVQAATLNRQFYTPFIAIWNHAVGNQWAEMRKWSRPRKPKGTNIVMLAKRRAGAHPVSYERGAEFVAEMSPAPAMIMTALFYTGMRPIELFGLEASSVNIAGRWITLDKTKTGEPRGIPMHEFVAPLFEALASRGGFVFRTHQGEAYKPKEDGGGQLKAAIAGARKRTKIMDISPYTGRHTASTQLVVNGIHPHIKDQILGHAVDDMSRHYTNVPQAALIEAINTLPVPDRWSSMEWWEDPLKWSSKLHKNMGRRTDLESKKA